MELRIKLTLWGRIKALLFGVIVLPLGITNDTLDPEEE